MPAIADAHSALAYIQQQAVDSWQYEAGSVWEACPVLTSNGSDHWVPLDLAVFSDPLRRGVPEHCCLGAALADTTPPDTAFRLLEDSGAWVQIAIHDRKWFWKPDPESSIDGPHSLAQLPQALAEEGPRLVPRTIMEQKKHRQGYLFDRIFPVTHKKLVEAFEQAVMDGWREMAEVQKRESGALERLCATALRVLCLQVFSHRGVLGGSGAAAAAGMQRAAGSYFDLLNMTRRLPGHLRGLRKYVDDTGHGLGADVEDAVFRALARDNEYDFASVTGEMLGPFYQAALMRNPGTGEIDKTRRKQHGVFYTSRRITQLIVDRLPIEEIPPEHRFLLDPACGSGSFLSAGHRRLAELARPRSLSETERRTQTGVYIQGNDKDPFAILVAELQQALDHPESECPFRFCSTEIEFEAGAWRRAKLYEHQPSVIVGNPPFLRFGNVEERAALFLDAACREWLRDGGLLGFIMPATFLSGKGRCAKVRERLLQSCEMLELWDLPRRVLSDEQNGRGGSNGGDIETCAVLLRKKHIGGSPCRLLRVDNSAQERSRFRNTGKFSRGQVCFPKRDWAAFPAGRWGVTPFVSALARLRQSDACLPIGRVAQVRSGIKRSPEEPIGDSAAPPTEDHVPWLQRSTGVTPYTRISPARGAKCYVRYPGNMEFPQLRWATRDARTGKELPRDDREWRTRGLFTRKKVLIPNSFDPASSRTIRAFIDVGHYPSNNFHFVWIDPELPDSAHWTYEAVMAVLNAPVSQAWNSVARTRNNPLDLVAQTPFPRLDAEAIHRLSQKVSAIVGVLPEEAERRQCMIAEVDELVLSFYPLSSWERDQFRQLDRVKASASKTADWIEPGWPVHGTVQAVDLHSGTALPTITIRMPGLGPTAELYEGTIPPEMPGWALAAGIEFQAELPRSEVEAGRADPLKLRSFRPLPFAYERAAMGMQRKGTEG